MSKLLLLTLVFLGLQSHATVQVSDLDFLMENWGVSDSNGWDDGHKYAAQLEFKKISATEAEGKMVIANELGQISSEQTFRIHDNNGKVSFDLDYTGDPMIPGWWDGPIGPTAPKLDPAPAEDLICSEVTDNGSFIDGNGKIVVQRWEAAFLNSKGMNFADEYPTNMVFNVTPLQLKLNKPILMLTVRWNRAGVRYYSLFQFNSPY